MKIIEIITETISEGRVYGWISPTGEEFQTEETNDMRFHNNVLVNLKAKGVAGTEHWDNRQGGIGDNVDYISQAIEDGWIRIGAIDHSWVFAQFSHKVATRPLNYLLRIIFKFRPNLITIDLMVGNGDYNSMEFDSSRKAIARIKRETGR